MAILIPPFALAEKIGGHVELDATTLDELIAKASARFGEPFREATKHALILVNGRSVNHLKGGRTPLSKQDQVWLVYPASGG
jgi:molybdopterin converting factor small subunit